VDVGGISVEASLQRVSVSEKQGEEFLDRYARLERRLALSRMIPVERLLPFEPEVVFPTLWLEALPLSTGITRDGVDALVPMFAPENDAAVWHVVDNQAISAPAEWKTKSRRGANRPANQSIGAGAKITFRENALLSDRELQLEAALDQSKVSKVVVSADGLMLQLDSHILAHQIIGTLLTAKDAGLLKALSREPGSMFRVRKVLTYSLKNVPQDRISAAYMFLAQLALADTNASRRSNSPTER
jgi:hypothetical protein